MGIAKPRGARNWIITLCSILTVVFGLFLLAMSAATLAKRGAEVRLQAAIVGWATGLVLAVACVTLAVLVLIYMLSSVLVVVRMLDVLKACSGVMSGFLFILGGLQGWITSTQNNDPMLAAMTATCILMSLMSAVVAVLLKEHSVHDGLDPGTPGSISLRTCRNCKHGFDGDEHAFSQCSQCKEDFCISCVPKFLMASLGETEERRICGRCVEELRNTFSDFTDAELDGGSGDELEL